MAASHARLRTWTPDKVRAKIQASMIANRLIDHVLGQVELTATQVAAGLGLLRKIVPDLQAVELSGEVEQRHIVQGKPLNEIEWQEKYGEGRQLNG